MGQVRKDILNGWKEIGGYVCRDIRTVERWEKQRGLPVRRVPGAGRATVYALISELDEWLENSKSDGPEVVVEYPADGSANGPPVDLPGDARDRVHSVPPLQWTTIKAVGSSGVEYFPAISANEVQTMIEENGAAASAFESRPGVAADPPVPSRSTRNRWIAGATVAIAAASLCILASPLARSRAKSTVEPLTYSLNPVGETYSAPYRSQVPGVDDLYLQGIYFYEQRTPESLEHSRDDFSAAIAKDPNYAPAYAGLSNTYNLLREYSAMPDAEAYPKAKAAAEHAVALDPKLPQAHASLGFVAFFWSWDTVTAEREFRTALSLDPSSVLAHHWYGSMLIHEGRFSEAIEQLDIAQRLDPTSAAVLSTRALALGLSGHRSEAIDMLQSLTNESPGVSSPHAILQILSNVQPHEPARFLDEMRRTAEMRQSDEMLQVAAAAEPAYRSGGENAMWTSILTTEERLHPRPSGPTYLMVDAEAVLGRNDAAFADLMRLAQRRDPSLIGVRVDPMLEPLRRDRRFGQLVAAMGVPALAH